MRQCPSETSTGAQSDTEECDISVNLENNIVILLSREDISRPSGIFSYHGRPCRSVPRFLLLSSLLQLGIRGSIVPLLLAGDLHAISQSTDKMG